MLVITFALVIQVIKITALKAIIYMNQIHYVLIEKLLKV